MEQYKKFIEDSAAFLQNHDALLNSLILSKQNAGNNVYTNDGTEGIPNGTEQPGQGIDQPSNEQSA